MKSLLIFLVLIQPGYMLKWIDLSHPHGPDTLMVTADLPRYNRTSTFKGIVKPGNYYLDMGNYKSGEHGGTHMDAPKHYVKGGRGLDEIPLEDTIAPGVMIDCAAEAKANNTYVVSTQKILDWEKIHGKIPLRAAVLINFNWSLKFDDEKAFKGATDLKNPATFVFPTVSFEALKWLFEERNLLTLGTDTLIPDPMVSSYPIHRLLLANNRIIVENLKDLFRLPPRGFRFHCSPVKYVGATGAQVRAFAMTGNDTHGAGRNKMTGAYARMGDDGSGADRNKFTAGLILCWIAVVWFL